MWKNDKFKDMYIYIYIHIYIYIIFSISLKIEIYLRSLYVLSEQKKRGNKKIANNEAISTYENSLEKKKSFMKKIY